MKHILIIVVFILAMATSAKGETILRLDDPWPPFVIQTGSTTSGFSVEILEAMLQKTPDIDVEYSFYPWKRVLMMVAKQKNAFTFLGRTEKRESEFKWVGPIIFIEMAIFKLSSRTDLSVPADLKSSTIGLVRGYDLDNELMEAGIDPEQIEEVSRGELNVKKLFVGRIEFVIENPLVMAHYVKKEGYQVHQVKKLAAMISKKKEYNYFGFNLSTDDRIIQQLNKALDQIKQNGKYDSILKKYSE